MNIVRSVNGFINLTSELHMLPYTSTPKRSKRQLEGETPSPLSKDKPDRKRLNTNEEEKVEDLEDTFYEELEGMAVSQDVLTTIKY